MPYDLEEKRPIDRQKKVIFTNLVPVFKWLYGKLYKYIERFIPR